jgi:hypothetical protein
VGFAILDDCALVPESLLSTWFPAACRRRQPGGRSPYVLALVHPLDPFLIMGWTPIAQPSGTPGST